MIINIYALTPEKVMDIKRSISEIKSSIIGEITNTDVIRTLDKIDSELTQAHRIKQVDPENFVKSD